MIDSFFVTDLHGSVEAYQRLIESIKQERPSAVFLGGDLLPHAVAFSEARCGSVNFLHEFLIPLFSSARRELAQNYPEIFLILGNDDPRREEACFVASAESGLWHYVHNQRCEFRGMPIYGLAYVPPTPFLLKDWERYDVSRYIPPGCLSPEEGHRTVPIPDHDIKWATIKNDLELLIADTRVTDSVWLLHSPPYDTPLDRAALDGKSFENVPLDVHVGSIAIRRFIEERQPRLTLHGHVHESTRLTGEWNIRMGKTICMNGAHDGGELALVRFDLDNPASATRELV